MGSLILTVRVVRRQVERDTPAAGGVLQLAEHLQQRRHHQRSGREPPLRQAAHREDEAGGTVEQAGLAARPGGAGQAVSTFDTRTCSATTVTVLVRKAT